MPHFVYMLRCAGGRIYTGYAVDVDARFKQHLEGKGAKFTRSHPPEGIAAAWYCGDKAAAAKVEYAIKKHLHRPEKEALIAAPESIAQFLPQLADLPLEVVDITKIDV